jgi:TPR repeat protein
MLGLNQPIANQPGPSPPSTNLPSMASLRETSFSGLDSFLEPQQPKGGGRRILLLVVLLAALGGAGWWTYTNYVGAAESRKAEVATSSASEAPAEKPSTKPTIKDAAPAPDAGSLPATVPAAGVPERPSENASTTPDLPRKAVDADAKPVAAAKPVTPATIVQAEKPLAKHEPRVTSNKASNLPAPAAANSGDAAFRKGEAYLYGRGVPKNCDEAVKNLKAASAKSSAKARSVFGTMYATGHCVPRDLPTSYLWFALALRVDPNNQILEKDLSAVWNQMTPPERQMATRMKQ